MQLLDQVPRFDYSQHSKHEGQQQITSILRAPKSHKGNRDELRCLPKQLQVKMIDLENPNILLQQGFLLFENSHYLYLL